MVRQPRVWIGLAVTLVFLMLFLYRTDFAEIGLAISRADFVFVIPAIGVYFIGVWFRSIRWSLILRPVSKFSPGLLFPVIAIGYMANNLLPARLGEFFRAFILGRQSSVSKSSILATIVIERIFDGIALLAMMIVVSLFVPFGSFFQNAVRLAAVLFAGGFFVILAMAIWPDPALRIVTAVQRRLPGSIGDRVGEIPIRFIQGLGALRRPGLLGAIFGCSLAAWLCEATMYYIITLSFQIDQPYSVLVLMTGVANLGVSLPSAPGGLGTFDALSKLTLTLFGVHPDTAAAYTIVLHAALWLPVTLLGVIYLWQQGLDLRHLARSAAGVRPAVHGQE